MPCRCVEEYVATSLDASTKEKFTEIKSEIEEKIAQWICFESNI